jgi:RNA polymerase sigma-70 factor (ECF subfamily)
VEVRPSEVTLLLARVSEGDQDAVSRLMPLVYNELRHIAARRMAGERPDHTLQATALVHEAYVRLIKQPKVHWKNRAHFFGVAAQLMRQILVDHARRVLRVKRGGMQLHVSLDQAAVFSEEKSAELLAVDEALAKLQRRDARQSQIVELKYFGGLTTEEAAEALRTSPRTVEREWKFAKSWLYMQLRENNGRSNRQMEQD